MNNSNDRMLQIQRILSVRCQIWKLEHCRFENTLSNFRPCAFQRSDTTNHVIFQVNSRGSKNKLHCESPGVNCALRADMLQSIILMLRTNSMYTYL